MDIDDFKDDELYVPEKPVRGQKRAQRLMPAPMDTSLVPPPQHCHNAQELLDNHPDVHEAVIRALSQDATPQNIRKLLQVPYHVTKEIEGKNQGKTGEWKPKAMASWAFIVKLAQGRIIEEMDNLPPSSLAIIAAIGTDKVRDMSGEATIRIEHVTKVATAEYDDLVQAACKQAQAQVVDSKVIDTE
jgi:hypothetical protein